MNKKLLLSFEQQDLLDARKYFFEYGLNIQEVFTVVVEMASLRSHDINHILNAAVEKKRKKIVEKERFKKVEADVLYDYIEDTLRKKD
jgi:hypothetical protein